MLNMNTSCAGWWEEVGTDLGKVGVGMLVGQGVDALHERVVPARLYRQGD